MGYSEETILHIQEKYANISFVYDDILFKFGELHQKLFFSKSREYLMQGAGRRLKILYKCIQNCFALFPVNRNNLLTSDELTDLTINLHAFFVNISGILDNLAWVFVYEHDLYGSSKDGKLGRLDIGLFNKKTQKYLRPELKDYLTSEKLQNWYKEYSKDYRDALAHRIPLYVPPAALDNDEEQRYIQLEKQIQALDCKSPEYLTQYNQLVEEQKEIGRPCVLFAHSLCESCKLVYFHAQVIADFATIEEIAMKFCDGWAL